MSAFFLALWGRRSELVSIFPKKCLALQRLLGRARWDANNVCGELLRYASAHLVYSDDPGTVIVDETGFLKRCDKSVGVQRQYSGTPGRIENCRSGVFLALATSRGRALIDRERYQPESWCEDKARRREAGIPQEVTFATKPQRAVTRLRRALNSGSSARLRADGRGVRQCQ